MYCERAEAGKIENANFYKMAGPTEGPPGLEGFGEIGEARLNFNRMSKGLAILQEISETVERTG